MNTISFIADTPAAALAQIQAELGPDAVVVSVRQLPAHGVARLLPGRRRIEVLAGVPESDTPDPSGDFQRRLSPDQSGFATLERASAGNSSRWRSVAWLEEMGLMSVFADRLQVRLNAMHGDAPPSLETEWALVSAALAASWQPAPPLDDSQGVARPHVFVGPPGSGKTAVLCKWLTLAVLTQDRRARVWRLDAANANLAEFLTLHCEMLGVPVERHWAAPDLRADLLFVDFPGAEAQDPAALTALRNHLAGLPAPRIHLVLNAAYEAETLLAQWRAFAPLQPEDIILTHLDEEPRRVKLWNLVWGTNCSVRWLSGGQKIPGLFCEASPAQFFPVKNP